MASWRLFRSRYAELFREVDQQHPAFWIELRECWRSNAAASTPPKGLRCTSSLQQGRKEHRPKKFGRWTGYCMRCLGGTGPPPPTVPRKRQRQ
ncbi:putative phospholipid-transporting atpase iia [Lasius niger]|uniref:Putative phospholipid-transporting atpase iia n=1 Tax=Lasius niger TaxID=67767 RepID=A0A0J7K3H4_LASNI|nr:putative phospholipid-transporting atpase iia [Lasius niger]